MFKELLEKRAALQTEMQSILDKAEGEKRAMDENEIKRFDEIKDEIRGIDATIAKANEARQLVDAPKPEERAEETEDRAEEVEERAFAEFLRGKVSEERAGELTFAANGAVVPKTIANKIIERVKELCPIYTMAERYNVKGTLSIPYYSETASAKINAAYGTEFTDLTSNVGSFSSIDLTGFLSGALTLVSQSLVNNSQFDIVGFVSEHIAQAMAAFIEKELLNGTSGKIAGLSGVTQKVTAASATAITADELITVQELIPDQYQGDACWIMNKATRTAIRKLKDGQGNYLLIPNFAEKGGYMLLGKPVYISENMSTMSTGKTAIFYGDMRGLAVKDVETPEVQVLREKYATQHAVGVVAWAELDAKVQDAQRIAKLVMA